MNVQLTLGAIALALVFFMALAALIGRMNEPSMDENTGSETGIEANLGEQS